MCFRQKCRLFLGLLAVLCAALVLAAGRAPDGEIDAAPQPPSLPVPYENAAEGNRISHVFTIPEQIPPGAVLSVYILHQYMEIRINGERRFAVTKNAAPHMVHTPGCYWAAVRLTEADAGAEVRVDTISAYRYAGSLDIRLTSTEQLYREVLRQDALMLFLSVFTLATGLMMGLTILWIPLRPSHKGTLTALSVTAAAAAVWKLAGLPFLHLLISWRYPDGFWLTGNLYMVSETAHLLVPLAGTVFLAFRSGREPTPVCRCCILAVWLSSSAAAVLQISGILDLHEAFRFLKPEYGVLVALEILDILRRPQWELTALVFSLAAAADLLMDYAHWVLPAAHLSRYTVILLASILICYRVYVVLYIREAIRQGTELRYTKTAMLMRQIRPHYIYNTLTSVYYLCDSDPQTAKEVVLNFNTYLQKNFSAITSQKPVPFPEELELTRAYLAVEQARFGDRLAVTFDTPHTAFRLPALTLQPLVENSVKYGAASGYWPEHILIRTRKTVEGSELSVEDDGAGFETLPESGETHVGLQNVRERLELLCGGTLRIHSHPGRGTTVTIRIPK